MQMYFKKPSLGSEVKNYKSRSLAKSYSHAKGIDFSEILSSIVKLTSIKLLLFFVLYVDDMLINHNN